MRTGKIKTDSKPGTPFTLYPAITSFTSSVLGRLLGCSYILLLVSGCASYGVVKNAPLSDQSSAQEYSIKAFAEGRKDNEIFVSLAFSGGGTRAATMTYGILQELRDTNVMLKRGSTRLLDEVDTISSVSGGSFTAAYYGLHGEGIFDTYEDVFLRKNVQKPLLHSLFNPFNWFGSKGRTERAVEYYQDNIFHGATYSDMMKPGRPLILINASDLAYGVRFSFVQEYFNLLCSDLLSFPVARAVAASSAVPVAFNPIVVENYPDCHEYDPTWINKVRDRAKAEENLELGTLVDGLDSYSDKEQRKYIHFVDGGITDNIGLRAYYDVLELIGGPKIYMEKTHQVLAKKMVLIVVDASTSPVYGMDKTNKQPSMEETMDAVSGVKLHRYNAASIDLVKTAYHRWEDEMSTQESPLTLYFIEVSFSGMKKTPLRDFINLVPTSFSLTDEQVDKLIETGRQLLRDNPDFKRLLADINNS